MTTVGGLPTKIWTSIQILAQETGKNVNHPTAIIIGKAGELWGPIQATNLTLQVPFSFRHGHDYQKDTNLEKSITATNQLLWSKKRPNIDKI
ncbi:6520_t:CDS:2 [Dentiscutata erythropus]|uniref:6520_t:CDS:1 n=1 Tax=Dentiscutata erythropus TaxID=1348616 RepID=A0A9N9NP08_9GLOM|nr:6520_t:CDS:2 [Dentiscutata erythropus]